MSYFSPPPGSQARSADFILTEGWMDGWVDGWMDGSVSTSFFFAYYSKTTRYITLVTFGPLRRRFKTSFVKNAEFLKNLIVLKKFRTNRGFQFPNLKFAFFDPRDF